MESSLDSQRDQVIITLTQQECLDLAAGGRVVDRNNPFDPAAKVEVLPYGDMDPTYQPMEISQDGFSERLGTLLSKANILSNNDIRVFVPQEVVRTTEISAETIAPALISGEADVVPRGGIRLEFGDVLGRRTRTPIE